MKKTVVFGLVLMGLISCKLEKPEFNSENELTESHSASDLNLTEKQKQISDAALSIVDSGIDYDPVYFSIGYPNGDVPADKGSVPMS